MSYRVLVLLLVVNVYRCEYKCQNDSELLNAEYKGLEVFRPVLTCGKVVKVYDGDTLTLAARVGAHSPIYRFSIRLANIDCPEIRTNNIQEKEIAIIARDTLNELVMNQMITLTDISYDKYGRILATLFYKDINISKWLISKRLAVEYNGGKKQIIDWKKYYQTGQK